MLEEEIAETFEHSKRYPPDAWWRFLKIGGLPHINNSIFCGPYGIRLQEKTMREIYRRSLDTIISTIIHALQNIADARKRHRKQALPVDEIVVCGGGSSNSYVQEKIRKAVHDVFPVHVNFLLSPGSSENLSLVALGGLLLLANQSTTRRRMFQREYFTWTCQGNDDDKARIPRDPLSNLRDELVAKFFTLDRQPIDSVKNVLIQCQTHLHLGRQVANHEGKLGWNLENAICWQKPDSPKIREGTRLSEAEGHFDAFPFTCFLSEDDVAAMPLKEMQDGVSYYQCQYVIEWTFNGTRVHMVTTIPRSGRLGEDGDPGTDVFRFQQNMHAEALFYPIGTAHNYDEINDKDEVDAQQDV